MALRPKMTPKMTPKISFTSGLRNQCAPPPKVTFGTNAHPRQKSLLVQMRTPTKSHFWYQCAPSPKVIFGTAYHGDLCLGESH